jgi:outer membrane protein
MKRITASTIILLAAGLYFAFSAQALEVGVRGYYWFPKISGDIAVGSGGSAGTKLSIENDLKIDDENLPSFEAFVGLGKHHLSLMYTPLDYSGNAVFSAPVSFQGKNYIGAVHSELNATMIDLDYQYDLINLENFLAGFSIGAILKFKYLDGDVKMDSAGVSSKETFAFPLPMVGIGAHIGILAKILEARAKFSAMGYSGNHIYEGLADVSWTPFPFLDIHGGYRFMKVKYDDDDVFIDADFSGPYVGLTVSF